MCLHYTATFISFNMWQDSQGYTNRFLDNTNKMYVMDFSDPGHHRMSGKIYSEESGLVYLFSEDNLNTERTDATEQILPVTAKSTEVNRNVNHCMHFICVTDLVLPGGQLNRWECVFFNKIERDKSLLLV